MALRRILRVPQVCRQAVRLCSDEATENAKTVRVLTGERGLNKVMLLGRVGKEPEMRGTDRTVTLLSLATSQSYRKGDGQYVQQTEWHRVAIFRPGLKLYAAQTINKGDQVYIEGSLNYSEYEGASGKTRSCTVIAEDLIVLKKGGANRGTESVITDDADDMSKS